jgi:hypothetical protein
MATVEKLCPEYKTTKMCTDKKRCTWKIQEDAVKNTFGNKKCKNSCLCKMVVGVLRMFRKRCYQI